jgi:ferrous iron transport protein A
MKLLTEWEIHRPARVTEVRGEEQFVRRLAAMGIHIGETIEIMGQAPFHGPLLILAKGAVTALRQGEAACVSVEVFSPSC